MIDAMIRHIEAREHLVRNDDGRSPDDQADADAQRLVDYVSAIGGQLYAFEHTGIEPFEDFIERDVHNKALFNPVTARFDGRPDGEFWQLFILVEASDGLSAAQVRRVQSALINWIETNAPRRSRPRRIMLVETSVDWGRLWPWLSNLCVVSHSHSGRTCRLS
jgi:hypothetical protein